jgi:hypothetical protein
VAIRAVLWLVRTTLIVTTQRSQCKLTRLHCGTCTVREHPYDDVCVLVVINSLQDNNHTHADGTASTTGASTTAAAVLVPNVVSTTTLSCCA